MNAQEEAVLWVKRVVKVNKAMKLMESNDLVPRPFFSPALQKLKDVLIKRKQWD